MLEFFNNCFKPKAEAPKATICFWSCLLLLKNEHNSPTSGLTEPSKTCLHYWPFIKHLLLLSFQTRCLLIWKQRLFVSQQTGKRVKTKLIQSPFSRGFLCQWLYDFPCLLFACLLSGATRDHLCIGLTSMSPPLVDHVLFSWSPLLADDVFWGSLPLFASLLVLGEELMPRVFW